MFINYINQSFNSCNILLNCVIIEPILQMKQLKWPTNLYCFVAEIPHTNLMMLLIHIIEMPISEQVEQKIENGSPGGSVVKNLPAKQEMWVQSLGQEDRLEKEMQFNPVFLPGKSHGQRSLGYSPWSCKRVRYNLEAKQKIPNYPIRNNVITKILITGEEKDQNHRRCDDRSRDLKMCCCP